MIRIFSAAMPLLLALTVHAQNGAFSSQNYQQQLAEASEAYFQDVAGDHDADIKAHEEFSALRKEHPEDPVVAAYCGSLDLLDAARTWAVWNKHSLSEQGLGEMDNAVRQAPDNLEVRFIRAATTWNLPSFFHRKEQAEDDFAYIAPRAEAAAHSGRLTRMLAAGALDYYGRVLAGRSDRERAVQAFKAAIRVDQSSPGGKDASKRLHDE